MDNGQNTDMSFANLQGFVPVTQRECSVDPLWDARRSVSSIEPAIFRLARQERESSVADQGVTTGTGAGDVAPVASGGK